LVTQVSKNICILYSSVPTADSEPEDNECVEIWSEEIIDDISDSESDPETKVGPPQNAPSMALARWVVTDLFDVYASSLPLIRHCTYSFLTFLQCLLDHSWSFLYCLCWGCTSLSFHSLQGKYLSIDNLNFRRYVVCKKCHQIYYLAECIEGVGSTQRSKFCSFKNFPHHPCRRMREPCGTLLLKTVEFASGKRHFYPFLTYCYLSLEVSIVFNELPRIFRKLWTLEIKRPTGGNPCRPTTKTATKPLQENSYRLL